LEARAIPEAAMKQTLLVVALAVAAGAGATSAVQAQEEVDKATAAAFDNRMFAGVATMQIIWRSIRSRRSAP
jgi:hypothetical protein